MSQLSCNFNEKDYDFSTAKHFSDVILVVDDTRFHVHRSILSMCSPVFEKMFTSDFAERTSKEIKLPFKRKDEFDVFLKVIYSNIMSKAEKVSETNFRFLLELAEEYQVSHVRELCSKFLISIVQESNCIEILKEVEIYNLKNVMGKCMEVACLKRCSDLKDSEYFHELTIESRLEIYAKRALYLENVLFRASNVHSGGQTGRPTFLPTNESLR